MYKITSIYSSIQINVLYNSFIILLNVNFTFLSIYKVKDFRNRDYNLKLSFDLYFHLRTLGIFFIFFVSREISCIKYSRITFFEAFVFVFFYSMIRKISDEIKTTPRFF